MIKIILINHSFQVNYFSRRWKLFAEKHQDFDVTLLAPAEYLWYRDKGYTYGKAKKLEGKLVNEGNFHIRLFRLKERKHFGWTSPDFESIFKEINPDIVYHIGTHDQESLYQVLHILKRNHPHTKRIAFSMRGPAHNVVRTKGKCSIVRRIAREIMYWRRLYHLHYVNRNVDAFFCHYPDAVDCFRKEGYEGPIYMQTQVGVNEEWFHEDETARAEIRKQYNIDDCTYVFGSATRFTVDKGVDDIINALPIDGNWKYLMMGTGSTEDVERIKRLIAKRGLEEKIILPGMVDWYDMAKYWNAVDCAIHVPRTTERWVETFSLSAIQPQITKKPVIANTSGSVPYQIGLEELIVPEGDIEALHKKIVWVLHNREEAKALGLKLYERTHNGFEIQHLNNTFYDTLVEDIIPGKFDKNKIDMATYKAKC